MPAALLAVCVVLVLSSDFALVHVAYSTASPKQRSLLSYACGECDRKPPKACRLTQIVVLALQPTFPSRDDERRLRVVLLKHKTTA